MLGSEPPPGVPESTHAAQTRWVARNTRRVRVPEGRTPQWFDCPADPVIPAVCLTDVSERSEAATHATPTGNYQPFPYLLPALVSRIDTDPDRLDRLMRSARALLALAALAAAVYALWMPGRQLLSLVGFVVSITPMVVFLVSTLNPSGLEIAAGIAFFACLLRVARGDADRWTWPALGASGAIVALSRGPAPLWIVLDLVVFFMVAGLRPGVALIRRGGRPAVVAGGAIAAGVLLNRVWEHLYGPRFVFDPTPVSDAVRAGWLELPGILDQQIGIFGYLEAGMTPLAYTAWFCMVAALVAIALLVGTVRERIALAATFVAVLALPIALVATVMRHTGYGLQGRYVLAFSVVLPLLAGEIVARRGRLLARLNALALFLPFAAVAGVIHVAAWYANARRYAVGKTGPDWFPLDALWSPPAGWWPWLVAALAGGVLIPLAWIAERRAAGESG